MRDWIVALLDPAPMAKGTHDPHKQIKTPPLYRVASETPVAAPDSPPASVSLPAVTNGTSLPPPADKMATRGRSLRSASPSKAAPITPRKIATPRRTKRGRPAGGSALATTAESAEDHSAEPEGTNGDSGVVRVDIESTIEAGPDGDEDVKTTHVTVETPANHPQLPLPTDAQAYLEQAKAAIREANNLTAGRAAGRKRKAAEISVEEDDDPEDEEVEEAQMEIQPAKRVRFTEQELRKEKIKRRATMGIAASLAIG